MYDYKKRYKKGIIGIFEIETWPSLGPEHLSGVTNARHTLFHPVFLNSTL